MNAAVTDRKAIRKAFIIAYGVLVGSTCYVAILEGLGNAPPLAFAGARTILGGTALLLVAMMTRHPVVPERRLWKWVPLVAMTATALTFGSMFLSPQFAGAGLPVILGNTQPLFLAAFAVLFLGERMTLSRWVSFGLASLGLLFVISPAVSGGGLTLSIGAALALLTSLAAAIGAVLVRWLKPGRSLLAFTGWQLLVGGIILSVVSAGLGEGSIHWSLSFAGVLLFLGLFNSAAFTFGWFWLLQQEEASKVGVYLFLIPVVGVTWAILFRGEIPSGAVIVGSLLILAGIFCNESAGFWHRLRFKG